LVIRLWLLAKPKPVTDRTDLFIQPLWLALQKPIELNPQACVPTACVRVLRRSAFVQKVLYEKVFLMAER
jgi:hypothetical protein